MEDQILYLFIQFSSQGRCVLVDGTAQGVISKHRPGKGVKTTIRMYAISQKQVKDTRNNNNSKSQASTQHVQQTGESSTAGQSCNYSFSLEQPMKRK